MLSFADVNASIKNLFTSLNISYIYVSSAIWSSPNPITYANSGGFQIQLFIYAGGYMHKCLWSSNELDLRGVYGYLDTTLTQSNYAADAKAVGDRLAQISNIDTSLNLTAPNGNKYILQVDNSGNLITIPVIPKKALYIGNSLLLGFGDFGMAASRYDKDYFHIITDKTGGINDRLAGSGFEGQTTEEGAANWINDNVIPKLSDDIDLVCVQLGDNVNTPEKHAVFPKNSINLLKTIREKCPKARVVWVGSWYAKDSKQDYINACKATGCEFIDITDITGASSIGAIYTLQNETTTHYDVDSFEILSNNYVRIYFTVNGNQYNAQIKYTSYTSNAGVSIDITGYEKCIVSSGVASHPSDAGFSKIANRIMEKLGIIN